MAIIIFVRHGQSETNANRILSSKASGYPLTPLGVSQVEATAIRLQKLSKPDQFFTSPIERAVQTADIISRAIGEGPKIEERLRERRFGSFEDMRFESKEMMREFTVSEINSGYSRGMESWERLKGRMVGFMGGLGEGTVSLAVSHYDPIRAAIAAIDKKYDDDLMPNPPATIPNASITVIDLKLRRVLQMGKEGLEAKS